MLYRRIVLFHYVLFKCVFYVFSLTDAAKKTYAVDNNKTNREQGMSFTTKEETLYLQ